MKKVLGIVLVVLLGTIANSGECKRGSERERERELLTGESAQLIGREEMQSEQLVVLLLSLQIQ